MAWVVGVGPTDVCDQDLDVLAQLASRLCALLRNLNRILDEIHGVNEGLVQPGGDLSKKPRGCSCTLSKAECGLSPFTGLHFACWTCVEHVAQARHRPGVKPCFLPQVPPSPADVGVSAGAARVQDQVGVSRRAESGRGSKWKRIGCSGMAWGHGTAILAIPRPCTVFPLPELAVSVLSQF